MESKFIQVYTIILIIEFCYIDTSDMVHRFQSFFFIYYYFYLIKANANHENWINEFPKSVYLFITLWVSRRCVFFLSFFVGKTKQIYIYF